MITQQQLLINMTDVAGFSTIITAILGKSNQLIAMMALFSALNINAPVDDDSHAPQRWLQLLFYAGIGLSVFTTEAAQGTRASLKLAAATLGPVYFVAAIVLLSLSAEDARYGTWLEVAWSRALIGFSCYTLTTYISLCNLIDVCARTRLREVDEACERWALGEAHVRRIMVINDGAFPHERLQRAVDALPPAASENRRANAIDRELRAMARAISLAAATRD